MTGPQLKELRKQKGFTQKELAAEFGVSESTVTKWENGINPIPDSVSRLLRSSILSKLPLELSEMESIHEYANKKGIPFGEAVIELIRRGLTLTCRLLRRRPGPGNVEGATHVCRR